MTTPPEKDTIIQDLYWWVAGLLIPITRYCLDRYYLDGPGKRFWFGAAGRSVRATQYCTDRSGERRRLMCFEDEVKPSGAQQPDLEFFADGHLGSFSYRHLIVENPPPEPPTEWYPLPRESDED